MPASKYRPLSDVTILSVPNPRAGVVTMAPPDPLARGSSPRRDRGKIFHFLICHLAHIRAMCDGF
jgi:hypothetical protein